MAEQHQIAGPVTITHGGSEVGQTDGRVLISIAMSEPSTEVTTDAAGGMPVDEIQHDSVALVTIVFAKRDVAIINSLRARLKAANTLAGQGEAQVPGLLRRGDSNLDRTLVLTGTKLTAAGGMQAYTFLDALADAQTDMEISEIGGNQESRLAVTMRCYSKDVLGVSTVYTVANVT